MHLSVNTACGEILDDGRRTLSPGQTLAQMRAYQHDNLSRASFGASRSIDRANASAMMRAIAQAHEAESKVGGKWFSKVPAAGKSMTLGMQLGLSA